MKLTRCQSVAAIVVSALIILAVVLGSLIGLAAKVQRGVLWRTRQCFLQDETLACRRLALRAN